jgi:hypothetical protein
MCLALCARLVSAAWLWANETLLSFAQSDLEQIESELEKVDVPTAEMEMVCRAMAGLSDTAIEKRIQITLKATGTLHDALLTGWGCPLFVLSRLCKHCVHMMHGCPALLLARRLGYSPHGCLWLSQSPWQLKVDCCHAGARRQAAAG